MPAIDLFYSNCPFSLCRCLGLQAPANERQGFYINTGALHDMHMDRFKFGLPNNALHDF
jgi:hypothetical protein